MISAKEILIMAEKVVITAALAGGGAVKKENSPNVPYTAKEFVDEAIRCRDAGAAVVHIHPRNPETGAASFELKYIAPIIEGIREKTDLLVNFTTGGLTFSTEERGRTVRDFDPDMASLNPGTMNFCFYNYKKEEFSRDETYLNPFSQTMEYARIMQQKKIKPELECFDVGHISNTLWLFRKDLVNKPAHYSFVFGVLGGIDFSLENLLCMRRNIPAGSTWQPIGVGPACFPAAMASVLEGGHIRVGLEDNIYIDFARREKAKGSWDQVEKAVKIARLVDREPATPAEAKTILNLPKRD
jgi:3-keto-5-aminohexanoate cleavage enzyme